MSQDYHQGIFNSFSNGFERSQQQQQHLAQQIRRDKLRGYEQPPPPLVGLEEEESGGGGGLAVYETGGMLSEMFNFQGGGSGSHAAAAELLDQSMARQQQPQTVITNSEWFSSQQRQSLGGLGPLTDVKSQNSRDSTHQHQISGINADSAAAMQLFLMNPQPKSPSPPPPPPSSSNSTIHMLLPNPSSTSLQGFGHDSDQGPPFGSGTVISPQQLSWEGGSTGVGGIVEGQGLSLSLSSSLQHLEAAKDGGLLYYSQGGGSSSAGAAGGGFGYFKNFPTHNQHQTLHLQGAAGSVGQNHPAHVGFGSSIGVVNVLRNSKYAKPAQELLEEFCSVGRGQFKKNKFGKVNTNPSSSGNGGGGGGGGTGSSSSTKEVPPLSASDRIEHQRRKVKLLSMLDEVDRRYNHYCEQMQMVVNSFDLVMGYGAAVPYTALAQKAMSRHFRCLKDAIAAQLKHSCELLGEKDGAGTSGITKGETPRLKILDQSLRQQRAFHQMGIMEQEAWRPQRGLPERSVNILRAWLFEHFLHPYPSDADKHLLSRQTGLSRNQVSNWFINARVRLWKPMIEEMYNQESKEEGHEEASSTDQDRETKQLSSSANKTNNSNAQTPTPTPIPTSTTTPTGKRSQINANESDSSLLAISTTQQCNFSETQASTTTVTTAVNMAPPPPQPHHQGFHDVVDHDTSLRGSYVNAAAAADYGTTTAASSSGNAAGEMGSTLIRFGTSTTSTAGGDVSLTLGLRHAGTNMPHDHKSSNFSIRDFGSCSFN